MVQTSYGPTRPPIIKLISFGAGRLGISGALDRLQRQARITNWFDEVELFDASYLDPRYYAMFAPEVFGCQKGFGLWSWKPYLINNQLSQLQEGDILVYVDAGVEINPRGQARFNVYLDHLARHDVLLFSLAEQNRNWTKSSVAMKLDRKHYFRNQVMATVMMLKKCKASEDLVSEWLELTAHNNGELLKDSEHPEFRKDGTGLEHRHDQTLLSLVALEKNLETFPDETAFTNWRESRYYPFLALRNSVGSTSIMWLIQHFPVWVARFWLRIALTFNREVLVGKLKKLRTRGLPQSS